MKLQPRNKRLVLEEIKNQAEKSTNEFLISTKKRPDNISYRIVERSDDCTLSVHTGDVVLIEGNMVEESRVGEHTFLTCKENFVIGLLKE